MQKALVRLTNNDRIIGELVYCTRDMVALYAPMLVSEIDLEDLEIDVGKYDKDDVLYMLTPYDDLSDSCLAIFDMLHVLTVNYPKKLIEDHFNRSKKDHYPDFSEYKKQFMQKNDIYSSTEDNTFNSDKLNEMFSEFLKPGDKSKLN